MKFPFLILLTVVASCGKVDVPDDQKLNTYNSLTPQKIPVGSTEYNRIKEICDAVRRKTESIGALVNTNYVFTGTTKDCTESGFSNLGDANVSLLNQNGSYKFGQLNTLYYFDDVETINEGVLSKICTELATLASPIATDPSSILFFTTENISGSDCAPAVNERCIKIEKATRQTSSSDLRARVHTREWIRVKLEEPRLGFFTYKKRISEASCEEGYYIGRTATLK